MESRFKSRYFQHRFVISKILILTNILHCFLVWIKDLMILRLLYFYDVRWEIEPQEIIRISILNSLEIGENWCRIDNEKKQAMIWKNRDKRWNKKESEPVMFRRKQKKSKLILRKKYETRMLYLCVKNNEKKACFLSEETNNAEN